MSVLPLPEGQSARVWLVLPSDDCVLGVTTRDPTMNQDLVLAIAGDHTGTDGIGQAVDDNKRSGFTIIRISPRRLSESETVPISFNSRRSACSSAKV